MDDNIRSYKVLVHLSKKEKRILYKEIRFITWPTFLPAFDFPCHFIPSRSGSLWLDVACSGSL